MPFTPYVIPAKAGIHRIKSLRRSRRHDLRWMPAFAGMTVLGLLLSASPLHATSADDLAKLQADLAARRQQESELKKQLDKTEGELADLRSRLVRAAREQTRSEDDLLRLQSRLDELQKKEKQQRSALEEQKTRMSSVVTALLRMGRIPPEWLLVRPDTPTDTIRSAILLRYALPHYAEEAQRLGSQLEELDRTRAAIEEKQNDMTTAQKDYTARQAELNTLMAERQNWLKATESQRKDVQKQIEALSKEAQNVQELINKVAAAPIRLPPSPAKNKLATKNGRPSFTPPAKGQILYHFGEADDVGSASKGLTLKLRGGDMIVAPADGQVVFAGPFKGYGNVLILRHGDDYHSFLAGFGRVDAAIGQTVNAGEPLGQSSMEQGPVAQVYYELRHSGTPVDPMQFLNVTNLATRANVSSTP
jgi:septal ring factor EnvC (AmiA/AmiB activator)